MRGVLDTALCDKVCQLLATDRWFSPGTLVSSTNKTVHHDITEILLKVALNTITITLEHIVYIVKEINALLTCVLNTEAVMCHTSIVLIFPCFSM
jgi:archaellum biogenesis ATPase FlaH